MDIKYLLKIEKIVNDETKNDYSKINALNNLFKIDSAYMFMLAISCENIVNINFEKKELYENFGNFSEISNHIKNKISKINVSEIDFKIFRDDFDKLIIPEYQRDYSWKSKTYNLFISSLLNSKETSINIGSVIISPSTKKEKSISFGKGLYIIDGQQRLTSLFGTLTLISYFYFVENKIKKLNKKSIEILTSFLKNDELNLKYSAVYEKNVISVLKEIFDFTKKYEDETDNSKKIILLKDFKKKDLLKSSKQIFYNEIKKYKNINEEIDSEKIDYLLESISKISFTTYITYGEKAAFKKFYETNSISLELSLVDIMRSIFYRFEFSKSTKWPKLIDEFNKGFKKNDDIQFFYFFYSGSLISPNDSFQKLEKIMINFDNENNKKQLKDSFLIELSDFLKIKNDFYKNILTYVKNVKVANIIWLFDKFSVNKQISNMLVVFWRKNNEFYIGNEDFIYNKLAAAIKAKKFYLINKNNDEVLTPRSNAIDSSLKAITNSDGAIIENSKIEEYINLLDKYIVPVEKESKNLKLYDIFLDILREENISFSESKLINYLLESVENIDDEKYKVENNNHEHLIPSSKWKTSLHEVLVFKNNMIDEKKIKINNDFLDLFYNLILCDSKFNKQELSDNRIVKKIDLILKHKNKITNYQVYEDMFEKMKNVFDKYKTDDERIVKLVKIMIDDKENKLKQFLK